MIVLSVGDSWREERVGRENAGSKLAGSLVLESPGWINWSGRSYVNGVKIHEKCKMLVETLQASLARC